MVGPITAVVNGVTRTFSWRGRASCSEYWFYVLFCWAVVPGLAFAVGSIGARVFDDVVVSAIMLVLFSLFSAMIRRLHDTGRSGAWAWIGIVPLIGVFWLLLLMTEPPQLHANRFGTEVSSGAD